MQVSAMGNNVEGAKDGLPQLVLYFQSKVQTGRENYLYFLLSFFAEVGGYVGLIMGYSLLNLGEFIISTLTREMSK